MGGDLLLVVLSTGAMMGGPLVASTEIHTLFASREERIERDWWDWWE